MASINGHVELLDYEEVHDGDAMDEGGHATGKQADSAANTATTPFSGHTSIHSAGFRDFLLKPELLKAICKAGFEHPSEVQAECIPTAMMGKDILCQAKSGMGKTAVFVIATLQELDAGDLKQPAIIALSPTRELAYQIAAQYQRFKEQLGVRLALFLGGTPISSDKEKLKANSHFHIVVGTPGRILALLKEKALDLSNIKHFIVDECDKMLNQLDMRQDVQQIFMATPNNKQVMMFSATLPKEIVPVCRNFMNDPLEVIVNDETKLILERLLQYYLRVPEQGKIQLLTSLLELLEYNQVIIFTNTVERAGLLAELLTEQNMAVIMIHSGMSQKERLVRYYQFKEHKKRLMVATDLFGRGIDVERVNVVINYDCPMDTNTYLHRIARAGRFGTKGLTVTFVTTDEDSKVMNSVQDRFDITIEELPDEIDPSLYQ